MNTTPARPELAALEQLLDRLADLLAPRIAHQLAAHARGEARTGDNASPWMSADSAARYLDWPKHRLYNLTAAGEIPHVKQDGRLLFHRHDLDSWLQGFAHETRDQ